MAREDEELKVSKHRTRHKELHIALDELVADWIKHGGGSPSKYTVLDLMKWSQEQTLNPIGDWPVVGH